MEYFKVDGSFIRKDQGGINTETREVSGFIMTPHLTIDGRRIAKDAFNHPTALTEFQRVPLFLWNHNRDVPIGKPKRLEMKGSKGIFGIGRVDEEWMWNWVLQGRVRGFSVGFKVLEWDVEESENEEDLDDPMLNVVFTKAQLFDMSVVSSPANTYCLFIEPNESNGIEYEGFPEQLKKTVDGKPIQLPENFERVALSSGLPMYLPRKDHFEMYLPFERRQDILKEKLEKVGITFSTEDWWIYGYATKFDEVDTYGTRMSRKAIEKALPGYQEWSNIREQHDRHKAVGTAPLLELDAIGLFVAAKISKGAVDTWEKILDGTLKGFSLGGVILPNGTLEIKERNQTIRQINDVELAEISVVDRPAVKSCGITLACKDGSREDAILFNYEEEEENREWPTIEELRKMAKEADEQKCPTMQRAKDRFFGSYQHTSLDNKENMGANGASDLPINLERSWDSSVAVKRVRNWAGATEKPNSKYQKAFFWYDSGNSENFGAYKLPFADIVNGTLTAIWRACAAAMASLMGARGGLDIPEQDRKPVYNRIVHYYKKAGKEPPEFNRITEEGFNWKFFHSGEKEIWMELEKQEPETEETKPTEEELPVEETKTEETESKDAFTETEEKTENEKLFEILNSVMQKLESLTEKVLEVCKANVKTEESTSEEKPVTEEVSEEKTSELERSVSTDEVKLLQEQLSIQQQTMNTLLERMEILGEGKQSSSNPSKGKSDIWEGAVPSLAQLRNKAAH